MTAETVVVHLIADATRFLTGLDAATSRLLAYTASLTASAARHGTMMATAFEKNTVAVQTMVKDLDAGTRLIEDLTNFAIETPFSSQEVIESAKQLKAFGFATQDIIPTLRALGNVSAGTGTSMERIILAFGQVRVAGKLMGTELRQFVDAGIPLIEELAKVMDKPVESIRLLTEQGQVGFNEVVQAFNNMNAEGGQFAGLMDVISKNTVAGRFQALSETFQVTARNFALAAFEGLGLKDVMNSITKEFSVLVKDRDQSGTVAFFRDLRTVVNAVVYAIRLGVESVVIPIKEVYQAVRRWVIENKSVLQNVLFVVAAVWALYAAVKAVTLGLIVMRTVMYSLAALSGILSLVSAVMTLKTVITAIVSAALSLATALLPVAAFLGTLFALAQLVGGASGLFRFSGEAFQKGKAAILDMKDAWTELVDAIGRGDYESAVAVFTASITYAWKVLIITLKGEWEGFKRGLATGWQEFKIGVGPAAQRASEDATLPLAAAMMKAAGKSQKEIDAGLEELQRVRMEQSVKIVDQLKEVQNRAAKDQAEMMKNLLDPAKNPGLGEAKRAMDEAILKSRQAGLDQKEARWFDQAQVDHAKAIATYARMIADVSKAGGGGLWADVLAAAGIDPVKQGTLLNEVQTKAILEMSPIKVTDQMRKVISDGMLEMAKSFSESIGSKDLYLPAMWKLQQAIGQAFAQMAAPYGISGKARDVMNELAKEMDKGVTSWEQEVIRLRAVNEAYFGSKFGQQLGGAVGGFFAVANNGAMGGRMTDAMKSFEDFQRIQRLQKANGGLEFKPPPAALAGTQAAQDIINANISQQLSVEQEMLAVLIASKTEAQEQTKLQKTMADAWDRLTKAGTIKAIGME